MDERVVGRNLVAALGAIVIVLLAVLLWTVVNYTSIISERNSVIAAKDSQIEALTNQVAHLQAWLDGNRTEFEQLTQQLQERKE
ncbi:MAG: hypothetical protein QXU95_05525, partial [Candidatus Bathyarchaeia archaeon]